MRVQTTIVSVVLGVAFLFAITCFALLDIVRKDMLHPDVFVLKRLTDPLLPHDHELALKNAKLSSVSLAKKRFRMEKQRLYEEKMNLIAQQEDAKRDEE